MIRLIASDLDGTLLDEDKKVPVEMFEIIRRLKEKGILFAASSGRQYANIRRLFEPVKDEIAYICENGALTIYQNRILYKEALERETAKEIVEAIWKKEGAEFTISGEKQYYLHPKSEEYRHLIDEVVKPDYTLIQSFDEIKEPCLKVAVYEKEGIANTFPYWRERFKDKALVLTSGFEWLDFAPKGVDKSNGIRAIQKELGIGREESMAFGDEHNDIGMLEAVDFSYAMETGKEKVKEVSRYQTSNVIEVLKNYL